MHSRTRPARPLVLALAALVLPLALAACDRGPADPPATGATPPASGGFLGRKIDAALVEAAERIRHENIDLERFTVRVGGGSVRLGGNDRDASLPPAEITPQGELLIDGAAVAVADPAAKAALQDYRREVESIAIAGIEIGRQGVGIGLEAAGEALRGVFSGNAADIEAKVKARTGGIEQAALALCDRMPALLRAEQAAAAAVPEFTPYARMTQADVDDCREDALRDTSPEAIARHGAGARDEVRDDIRRAIRDGIRDGVRAGAAATAGDGRDRSAADAAQEADDAAAAPAR